MTLSELHPRMGHLTASTGLIPVGAAITWWATNPSFLGGLPVARNEGGLIAGITATRSAEGTFLTFLTLAEGAHPA